jgi:hypothetical protein
MVDRREIILERLIDIIKSYVRKIENDVKGELENGCINLDTLAHIIQSKLLIIYKIEEQEHNKIKKQENKNR